MWTTYSFSALKPNEEMDNLFLLSPKGELMFNIKGKGRPRGGATFFWEKIKLHNSFCCNELL